MKKYNMRILITGAGGLIGSHLVPLLEKEHELITVSGKINNAGNLNIDFSKDWSTDLLPAGIDAIVHLAQSEDFRDFPGKAKSVFNVNTVSTLNLADFAVKAGIKKFIYASSAGIYGNSDDAFTEEQQIIYKKEMGFYLGTKYCSEVILNNYTTLLDVQQLRFFFVYGKGQRKDMLIPRLINNVKAENPITLLGKDGIKINPLHASDAAKAIKAALDLQGSHIINAGGPEVLSLRKICEIIADCIGTSPVFNIEEKKPGHLMGDISRMTELLIAPEIKFSDGIKTLI
jgi:nucleoside-diphosphate-sugar epimerase